MIAASIRPTKTSSHAAVIDALEGSNDAVALGRSPSLGNPPTKT
jgi:hypothetical protein